MAILSYRDKDGTIKEIPALRGEKGEPGNDYILTENDKQEIANMVPIDEAVTDLIGDKTEIFSLASQTDIFGYIDATGETIYGDADTSESAIYSYELSYIDDLKPLSNIIHVKTKVYDYMGYRATGYSGEHVLLEFGTPSTMSKTKFENSIWEFDIDLSQYDYDLINIDISSCDGAPQVSWLKDTVWEEIKNLNNHINDFENPHQVTAEQIGAAPAGYGLGEFASVGATDCNELTKNGWYSVSATAQNSPDEQEYTILVISNGTFITQIFFRSELYDYEDDVTPFIRFYNGNFWTNYSEIILHTSLQDYLSDFITQDDCVMKFYEEMIQNGFIKINEETGEYISNIPTKEELETEVTDIVISGIMNPTKEGNYGPIREALQSAIADEFEYGGPIGEVIWCQIRDHHEGEFNSVMEMYGFLTNDEEEGYIENVYTKAEVDTQVGNIETELKAYIEETILGGAW